MATKTYQPSQPGDTKGNESWQGAKDSSKEAFRKAGEAGEQALNAAREQGKEALGKVKEAGNEALDKARETAQSVGHLAAETATAVGRKAEDMTAAAGHGIAGFGEAISQKAPQAGVMGVASHAIGDTIQEGGRYLEEHKLTGMARDVETLVKNHPIPALLAVLGLGFCIGRAMRD